MPLDWVLAKDLAVKRLLRSETIAFTFTGLALCGTADSLKNLILVDIWNSLKLGPTWTEKYIHNIHSRIRKPAPSDALSCRSWLRRFWCARAMPKHFVRVPHLPAPSPGQWTWTLLFHAISRVPGGLLRRVAHSCTESSHVPKVKVVRVWSELWLHWTRASNLHI